MRGLEALCGNVQLQNVPTKTLPSRKPKLLCQPVDLPMQECDFIFFFIQQRAPLRWASLLCFHT